MSYEFHELVGWTRPGRYMTAHVGSILDADQCWSLKIQLLKLVQTDQETPRKWTLPLQFHCWRIEQEMIGHLRSMLIRIKLLFKNQRCGPYIWGKFAKGPIQILPMRYQNKKSSGSPEFFKKYSLPLCTMVHIAPRWCILRPDGAQVPHIPL